MSLGKITEYRKLPRNFLQQLAISETSPQRKFPWKYLASRCPRSEYLLNLSSIDSDIPGMLPLRARLVRPISLLISNERRIRKN
jgi:hypothetical protein